MFQRNSSDLCHRPAQSSSHRSVRFWRPTVAHHSLPPPPHSCYVHNRLSCPFDYFRTRARQFRDMLHCHDVTTIYPNQQTPNHTTTNCLAAFVQWQSNAGVAQNLTGWETSLVAHECWIEFGVLSALGSEVKQQPHLPYYKSLHNITNSEKTKPQLLTTHNKCLDTWLVTSRQCKLSDRWLFY
jgi:hypothetical protein